jgi:hypothetical protein
MGKERKRKEGRGARGGRRIRRIIEFGGELPFNTQTGKGEGSLGKTVKESTIRR